MLKQAEGEAGVDALMSAYEAAQAIYERSGQTLLEQYNSASNSTDGVGLKTSR